MNGQYKIKVDRPGLSFEGLFSETEIEELLESSVLLEKSYNSHKKSTSILEWIRNQQMPVRKKTLYFMEDMYG